MRIFHIKRQISGSHWRISRHDSTGPGPPLASQAGTKQQQLPSLEKAHAVITRPQSSFPTVHQNWRRAVTTYCPLVSITALVSKVSVSIFCSRQCKVLFLGQFRSSESCSLGPCYVSPLQNIFYWALYWHHVLSWHFRCNKLHLWMLITDTTTTSF